MFAFLCSENVWKMSLLEIQFMFIRITAIQNDVGNKLMVTYRL